MKNDIQEEFAFHEPSKDSPYFEGWYYKIQAEDICLGIVVGIHQQGKKRSGFLQVLSSESKNGIYLPIQAEEIEILDHPVCIRMKDSEFSAQYLHLHDEEHQLHVDVQLHSLTPLQGNVYQPTIMGPFSYFPMECIHHVISLSHHCEGCIRIGNRQYDAAGVGYMEKDRGVSFPKRYLWFQSNDCQYEQSCFFLSVADIPIKSFSFQGMIAVLMIKGKQKRFATYLGARISQLRMWKKKEGIHVHIQIRQGFYQLDIQLLYREAGVLKAPCKGAMTRSVMESLNSIAKVSIQHHHRMIGRYRFQRGGCEISGFYK